MPKTAFVTIAGRTNAGKSSLLNAIVGEKIASVTSKPQTTRTRITGIRNIDDVQLVFVNVHQCDFFDRKAVASFDDPFKNKLWLTCMVN